MGNPAFSAAAGGVKTANAITQDASAVGPISGSTPHA